MPNQVSEQVAENAKAQKVQYDDGFLECLPGNRILDYGLCQVCDIGTATEGAAAEESHVIKCHKRQRREKSVEEYFSHGKKRRVFAADFFGAERIENPR